MTQNKVPTGPSLQQQQRQKNASQLQADFAKSRKTINIIICGHVDSGKSTLIGNLLIHLNVVTRQQIMEAKKQAKINRKDCYWMAYLMDEDEESQKRGVTIDIAMK